MPSIIALLRPAALFALAPAALQHAASGTCDAGHLAETLSASNQAASKELWSLCKSHYSEGVCSAASRELAAKISQESRSVSLQQLASAACTAVEGVTSRQRALLLRQHRAAPQRDDAMESRLEDIRRSASVHRLSRNVARRYRGQAAESTATDSDDAIVAASLMSRGDSSVDDALHHKSPPFPHYKFTWETNHSKNSSVMLEKKVEEWKQEHRATVNVTSPSVKRRAEAFKEFVTKKNATEKNDELSQNTSSGKEAPLGEANKEPAPPAANMVEEASSPAVNKEPPLPAVDMVDTAAAVRTESASIQSSAAQAASGAGAMTKQRVVPRSATAESLTAIGVPTKTASDIEDMVNEVMDSPAIHVTKVEVKVTDDGSPLKAPEKVVAAAPASKGTEGSVFSMKVPWPPVAAMAATQVSAPAEPQPRRGLLAWVKPVGMNGLVDEPPIPVTMGGDELDDVVTEVMGAGLAKDGRR